MELNSIIAMEMCCIIEEVGMRLNFQLGDRVIEFSVDNLWWLSHFWNPRITHALGVEDVKSESGRSF
jgi:hypothetical protein